jgi:NADH-quinone oxidoreductase subunit J
MIGAVAFYALSAILLVSALMVVSARNPVHSVLFLILAFFNAAGLFVLLGAEFVAMILIIVYVGAVAVLFLFVVMMLDISFADLRKGAARYVPLGLLLAAVLLTELVLLYSGWSFAPEVAGNLADPAPGMDGPDNTRALGAVLYTDYIFPFQISGLVLLVAMIGAIVLTLRTRSGVRRQCVSDQAARRPQDAMEIQKVSPGAGAV